MASNQHRNLTGEQLHNPKGFDGASPSTTLIKNAAGDIEWRENTTFDNALDYVSPQTAPPTEVEDDIYLLDDTGVVYDIDTIAWQSGNTIRYTFNGTPNLSAITAGDYLVTSGNGNSSNDGTFVISAVNDGSDYIEITNANRSDATDDEASDAVGTAYYTLEEWDGASKGSHIKFDGTNWNSVNAQDGALCYDETSSSHRIYDAANTNWDSSLPTSAVTASGTPVDNQVAVFTSATEVEGHTGFTYNSAASRASLINGNLSAVISPNDITITAEADSSSFKMASHSATSSHYPEIRTTRTRGTVATPTAIQSGDDLLRQNFFGHNGSTTSNGANIIVEATENWSGSNKGVSYTIGTEANGGTGIVDRIKIDGSGDITLGNFKFDGTQTVGAGQDNYVLTYDNATGLISLEAAAGGGGGLWTNDGGGQISYSASAAAVQVYETGFANTYGSAVTLRRGIFVVGEANTIGDNVTATTVGRTAVFGGNHTVGNIGTTDYAFTAGYNNTIEEGLYNIAIGNDNDIKNTTDSGISIGTVNTLLGSKSIIIGDNSETQSGNAIIIGQSVRAGDGSKNQVALGKNFDVSHTYYSNGFYVDFGSAIGNRPTFALTKATGLAANAPLNMALGSDQGGRNDGLGAGSTNAGSGVFWHFARSVTEPTANLTDGVALYVKDRSGTTNRAGYMIKAEDGTQHYFSDFSAIGGDETVANANKTLTIAGTGTGSGTSSLLCEDSGGTSTFEVLDNGTAKSTGQIGSSAGATPNTETPTGTTETIDWNNGNYQILDLETATGDVTLTLSNPVVGFGYFIEIRQDSTTPLDVIFPSSVKFAGETAPYTLDVSTGANAVDAVSLAWNGSEYIASFSQNHG